MDATVSARPASRLLWNPESAGRSGGACDGIGTPRSVTVLKMGVATVSRR